MNGFMASCAPTRRGWCRQAVSDVLAAGYGAYLDRLGLSYGGVGADARCDQGGGLGWD